MLTLTPYFQVAMSALSPVRPSLILHSVAFLKSFMIFSLLLELLLAVIVHLGVSLLAVFQCKVDAGPQIISAKVRIMLGTWLGEVRTVVSFTYKGTPCPR